MFLCHKGKTYIIKALCYIQTISDTSFWSISRYDIKVERRMGIRYRNSVNVGE